MKGFQCLASVAGAVALAIAASAAGRRERARNRLLADQLEDSERRRKDLQALARIGDWEFDLATDEIRWSDETFRIFGLEPQNSEPAFVDLLLSIHPEDTPLFDRAIQEAISLGKSYNLDLRIQCPDGSQKYIHAQGVPTRGSDADHTRIIGSVLDITERKQAEQALLQAATYDSLTQLFNRRFLLERLDAAQQTAHRHNQSLSVCLCDLDCFKTVNDTYGHGAGDDVLQTFGRLLREGTRLCDVPGRLGGDEFCMVFPNTVAADAEVCVQRIRERLQNATFFAAGRTFQVTATFGIAQFAPGMAAKALLEKADEALYRGKKGGRNCVFIGDSLAVGNQPAVAQGAGENTV